MNEQRHPHPHIDPRQPRNRSRPGTNPPVFAWKPPGGAGQFDLTVARDEAFTDRVLEVRELADPLHLPERALAAGRHFWKWSAGGAVSEVFSFEITPDAVTVEVPAVGQWLDRLGREHPRIYVRPQDLPALRQERDGPRAGLWAPLRAKADGLLDQAHEIEEPPFLPDRSRDYEAWFEIWRRAMQDSRQFVGGAHTLALAYLASGQADYARAACRRMASISRWDPEGSSHLPHNDEAHMSVIWHGPAACDWVWDQFTDEERSAVIEQFRRRGQITYEYMHDHGTYGVTRFDSHAGREVVFLAMIALVFHEHIPEARAWLAWLRPVLCGIWPIWAGDDGGWAEGPSYGLAYVTIMTLFATALKRGAGVDLYRRPFWTGHARWRQYGFPPYAEWVGFGDSSEYSAGKWNQNADLVEVIDRETGAGEFGSYVAAFRREAGRGRSAQSDPVPASTAQRYLAAPASAEVARPLRAAAPGAQGIHRVFPGAGLTAIRTHLEDPARDIALIFRSSPYGAVSHSHANNNDFILHVAGKVMVMPSGYYAGYGSAHHAHWVWHSRSHNCVTLSGASQLMRSHDSRGAIERDYENEHLVYFRGNADSSYADRADRCRRHVVFLKAHAAFLMIDEFVARPGIASALEWNLHSWNAFTVDEPKQSFLVERDGSSLEGHVLWHENGFFTLSEGWDPPPMEAQEKNRRPDQYHLRFTPTGYAPRRNFGVILCAGHASLARAEVRTAREGDAEVARLGEDRVWVNQGREMACEGFETDALAALVVQGTRYHLRDEGLAPA